jgi:MarR family transcriptional regulator for hemolysin
VKLISVTPEGRRVLGDAGGIVERMQREILESLPEEQRESFAHGLEALVAGPLASPSHVERPQRRPRERVLVPN